MSIHIAKAGGGGLIPPAPLPAPLFGVLDRQGTGGLDIPNVSNHLGGYVIKANWVDIQPTVNSALAPAGFADVALAKSRLPTTRYKLRIYCGTAAPLWVRNTAGVGTWEFEDPDDVPLRHFCPRFWRPAYEPVYRQMMEKVRDYFVGDPFCVGVQNSMCGTLFAEVMQRQMNADFTANAFRTEFNAAKAGDTTAWTHSRDYAAILQSIQTMSEVFADRTRWTIDLSMNPYQDLLYDDVTLPELSRTVLNNATTGVARNTTRLTDAYALGDQHRTTFGKSGLLMNNGFSLGLSGGESAIYTYMQGKGPPIATQTETMAKLTDEATIRGIPPARILYDDIFDPVAGAIARGCQFVEMPSGWEQKLTTAEMDAANSALFANRIT